MDLPNRRSDKEEVILRINNIEWVHPYGYIKEVDFDGAGRSASLKEVLDVLSKVEVIDFNKCFYGKIKGIINSYDGDKKLGEYAKGRLDSLKMTLKIFKKMQKDFKAIKKEDITKLKDKAEKKKKQISGKSFQKRIKIIKK